MTEKRSFLIVDYNAVIRRTLKRVISEFASEIYECSRGDLALDAYRENRPDWVLMDIEMPGLDGLTATGQIHASFPDAQIVIVTNYDDPDIRAAAREA